MSEHEYKGNGHTHHEDDDCAKSSTPKIDEILKKLYSHHLTLVAYLMDNRAPDPKFSEKVMLAEAKDLLYQLILEVISEDEEIPMENRMSDIEQVRMFNTVAKVVYGRNTLRQTQRQKLSELFKKEDK